MTSQFSHSNVSGFPHRMILIPLSVIQYSPVSHSKAQALHFQCRSSMGLLGIRISPLLILIVFKERILNFFHSQSAL